MKRKYYLSEYSTEWILMESHKTGFVNHRTSK